MIDAVLPVWLCDQSLYELTKRTIPEIKKLDGINLIIVDNGSPMGGGYLRSQADIYLRVPENLGYAPAMNMGLNLTTSKYISFVSNDTIPSPNAFKVGKKIMGDNKDVGSVHYRMLRFDSTFKYGNDTWPEGKERWCTISFCMFRKKAFHGKYFDEKYVSANYEDWDLLHRVRHVDDWKTAYTNKACYIHEDSATQRRLDQEKRAKNTKDNRNYFKVKWGEFPEDIWEEKYPDQYNTPWRPFP